MQKKKSEHPLGITLYQSVIKQIGPIQDPDNFVVIPGKGVIATLDEKLILVGNEKLMLENNIDISIGKDFVYPLEKGGKTVVMVAFNDTLIGVLAIADRIKSHASDLIQFFENKHIATYLLTGDNNITAESIGKQLGIRYIISEILPEEKMKEITRIQSLGYTVAMVGDGINDVPALAAANVGIAMGNGTDIAIDSASVVMMKGDLLDIIKMQKLAYKTFDKIKQNLFWAFIYNLIGIPVAALGHLDPVIAGGAMAFSSVSVVLNSLYLRKYNFK